MKLIALNIWGGKAYEALLEWVKKESEDTDIFCFQEVFSSSANIETSHNARMHILDDLGRILVDYDVIYSPTQDGFDNEGPVDFDVSYGLATFVKKPALILSFENTFVYGERNGATDITTIPANLLYANVQIQGKEYGICNFHGIAHPGDKLDDKKRLLQSQNIINFLAKKQGKKILCGDFNLLPGTKSIAIIEEQYMQNLITKFKIARTRSNLSPYHGTLNEQKYADFTFVSPDVIVSDFQVPEVPVSDHLPMILYFS